MFVHAGQDLPCPSLGSDFEFGAAVLHFQREFLLTSVLPKGFRLFPDLFDFVDGRGEFEFALRPIKMDKGACFFGLGKGYDVVFRLVSQCLSPFTWPTWGRWKILWHARTPENFYQDQ